MDLMNILKKDVNDIFYMAKVLFCEIDIRDIPYQFNVLFPKVPNNKERKREISKKVVSLIGFNDGETFFYSGRYLTSEDIARKREKAGVNYSN